MTSKAFRERLARRTKSAGVSVDAKVADLLEAYLRLLARWNAKVNLTALPLEEPTDETFDRLLIEPLSAARTIDETWTPWIDIGSGGGSPAIPLKLVKPALQLTMVESKTRKAAFLREVIRELGLLLVSVDTSRFEDLAGLNSAEASSGLVTVRAVRFDNKLITSVGRVLRSGGRLLAFRESPSAERIDGFEAPTSTSLLSSRAVRTSYLVSYERQTAQ